MAIKATYLLLLFSVCSILDHIEGIAYVISGHEALPGEFPWQVLVNEADLQYTNYYKCGGVIISKNWILSTASCLQSFHSFRDGRSWSAMIYVGTLDKSRPAIVHQSSKVIYHPNYNKITHFNDIALIKTKHEIKFNPRVSAIPLAQDPISSFVSGDMAGWGYEYYQSGNYANKLRITSLNIISRDDCRALLETEKTSLGADQFCAAESGAAACKGDEGGAFVTQYSVLSGLIHQNFCTLNDLPTVFVDVYHHREWIYNITGPI
ncbi:trypsin delta-like isoform X1 [Cloeon dipterum]|uniref:trypsin delta-like isoform X1 n=1 Tax=Cloeon dipterum TaxID=197152 RepID=UPI00321F6DFB